MKIEFEKSNEDFKTSVLSILKMIPSERHKFYSTENGRDIVKGLILEAEQNKKANKETGLNWTEDQIEATLNALREASEDNFKIIMQLLPGPVQHICTEHFKKERQNNGLSKSKVVPLIEKGARKGSAGYELWLAKRKQHDNVQHEDLNKPVSGQAKTPKLAAPKPAPKPSSGKTPKPVGYGKFIAKKPKKAKSY